MKRKRKSCGNSLALKKGFLKYAIAPGPPEMLAVRGTENEFSNEAPPGHSFAIRVEWQDSAESKGWQDQLGPVGLKNAQAGVRKHFWD